MHRRIAYTARLDVVVPGPGLANSWSWGPGAEQSLFGAEHYTGLDLLMRRAICSLPEVIHGVERLYLPSRRLTHLVFCFIVSGLLLANFFAIFLSS